MVWLLPLVLFAGCRRKEEGARGVSVSSLKDQPRVRVLLVNDVKRCLFSCDVSLTLTCIEEQESEVHFKALDEPVTVEIENGMVSFAGWGRRTAGFKITPEPNGIFAVNGRRYRGAVEIFAADDGNSFDLVNVVAAEEYLAGVIGAEMPSYWEPQALESQAIAARTYCLYIKEQFGTNRKWDVRKTAANQVYNGVSEESAAVREALENTAGQVLVCRGGDGKEDIFPTYYSSVCAGHTENSRNVFGDEFGPLAGVPCRNCFQTAKKQFLNWPSFYITKAELDTRLFSRYPQLEKLGKIEKISAESSSRYDGLTRLTRIRLEGADGSSDTLRAEDFRLAVDPTGFKIKSAAFEIQNAGGSWAFADGWGYGHGVGMCQCGAEALARKGKSAEEILSYYYPGSKIKKLY